MSIADRFENIFLDNKELNFNKLVENVLREGDIIYFEMPDMLCKMHDNSTILVNFSNPFICNYDAYRNVE